MSLILDDLTGAFGDWWWRVRTPSRERARVLERQGPYYTAYRARRWHTSDQGEGYSYGDNDLCIVPHDHHWEEWHEERIIGVVNGQVIATPFKGTGRPMDETELSEFFHSHAIADLGSEYEREGRGFGGWKLILFILAAAVIGFVVWKYVMHGHMPGTTVAPTITPTPTPGGPHMAWLYWAVSNV